ncbi:MAG: sensor histidine kinase [Acidimicrobiales bacterium]
MRLSARLALVFGVLGLITISLVASISWVLAAAEVRASTDELLLRRAETVVQAGVRRQAPEPQAETTRPGPESGFEGIFSLANNDSGVQLFTAGGMPIGEHRFEVPAEVLALAVAGEPQLSTITAGPSTFRYVTVGLDQQAGSSDDVAYFQFYNDISAEEQALSDLAVRLLVTAGLGLVAVAIASWIVGRWLARPLGHLAEAAGRLSELNDLPDRIELERNDEIGHLAKSFNRMLSALQVGREQQRRLVADAGHELRTPLTALRGRTEFLASAEHLTDEERRTHQRASVDDVGRLSSLVAELLDLAADPRTAGEEAAEVSLDDIIVEVATRTEVATGRQFIVQTDNTTAVVRPTMIRRALQNLVDNAIKFSSDPHPVTIAAKGGRIEVIDEGIGIAPGDIGHIFDRFFRTDSSRSQPGTGLGLAIVAQVAEAHGGTVWATSEPGVVTRVGFSVKPQ